MEIIFHGHRAPMSPRLTRRAREGVIVRWLERPAALRASLGFFTDEDDLARLLRGVTAMARGDC